MATEPLLLTRKDVLTVLPGRSEKYVSDMKRNGLKLPTTRTAVLNFLQRHPHPSAIRCRPLNKYSRTPIR